MRRKSTTRKVSTTTPGSTKMMMAWQTWEGGLVAGTIPLLRPVVTLA